MVDPEKVNPEKEAFFASLRRERIALTFDDVRMEAGPSQVSAADISTASYFSRNVELKTPIVSAAMDTVTESRMAIAMAKLGGLGVIHAGLDIESQKKEVRRVKFALNEFIDEPRTFTPDVTLEKVLQARDEHKWTFHTFPVVDDEKKLLGLLTQGSFRFSDSVFDSVGAVMTPIEEIVSAPNGTSLEDAYKIMKDHKKTMLPLLDDDGILAGLYLYSDVKEKLEEDRSGFNLDKNGRLRTAAAIPTDDMGVERVREMYKHLDVAVIDTAQGDSSYAFAALKNLKENFPDLDVVVGNISNPKSARLLAEAGADGIKVGQGPGSICTTRIETGIGTPQVTAVYECARAVSGFGIPVCADGGIANRGDIPIAIAAGGDSVMMGGRLAGTKESPGEIIQRPNGAQVKLYRGMGSPSALKASAAARERYGSDNPLAEGVETEVPFRGSVVDVVKKDEKALRKGMSYTGAATIKDHHQETNFYRITNAGLRESHPHDVEII